MPPLPRSEIGPQEIRLIRSAFDARAPEGGSVTLANLGTQILKLSPSFDPRTFGFQKLSDMISSLADFEIDNRSESKTGKKNYYVTLRSQK